MYTKTTQELAVQQAHAKWEKARSELGPYEAKERYISHALKLFSDAMRDLQAQLSACAVGVDVHFVARIASVRPFPEEWMYERDDASLSLAEQERSVARAYEELLRLERLAFAGGGT